MLRDLSSLAARGSKQLIDYDNMWKYEDSRILASFQATYTAQFVKMRTGRSRT